MKIFLLAILVVGSCAKSKFGDWKEASVSEEPLTEKGCEFKQENLTCDPIFHDGELSDRVEILDKYLADLTAAIETLHLRPSTKLKLESRKTQVTLQRKFDAKKLSDLKAKTIVATQLSAEMDGMFTPPTSEAVEVGNPPAEMGKQSKVAQDLAAIAEEFDLKFSPDGSQYDGEPRVTLANRESFYSALVELSNDAKLESSQAKTESERVRLESISVHVKEFIEETENNDPQSLPPGVTPLAES